VEDLRLSHRGSDTGQAGLPPRQLPADTPAFVGRAGILARLDQLLVAASPTAVTIAVLDGAAGVGKTTSAVHWAHLVADRFPDGQLAVNLRGFHPTQAPMSQAEAMRGFLIALGVPGRRIPADLPAQAALYRSLLSGRRVLVLLDNASSVEQVRILLPGSTGCLVLVTSRERLPGLVAIEGARSLTLDLMSAEEARELLVQRLGADRVAAEPTAAAGIVEACGHLPLALVIVAARAATHPVLALADLASELRDAGAGLDAFQTGDAAADVRTAFSWSYQHLTPDTARLFRLLGVHPGPTFSAAAAASIAGSTVAAVRPLLAELVRAHLVDEPAHDRYALHDLVRAYAHELSWTGGDEERPPAERRMLDHYLHTGHHAAMMLEPHREPLELAGPAAGTVSTAPANDEQARAWFTTEFATLAAMIDRCATTGRYDTTWQLAWTPLNFLDWQGRWHDLAAIQGIALTAGQRLGDRGRQAESHRYLGYAYVSLGRSDDVRFHLLSALDVYQEMGNHSGQAKIQLSMAVHLQSQGRYEDALAYAGRALGSYQAAGDEVGRGRALNVVGWCHAHRGEYPQALALCTDSAALLRQLGDQYGVALAHDSLGYIHHRLGDHPQAVECYETALAIHGELDDQYHRAEVLGHLGDTHAATGAIETAEHLWREALAILDRLEHPDAEALRRKLNPPAP
jgi:tetratricopeptide (TPR) repeat protein